MKKYIRRILFYIRYEMTSDVETRIEMGIAICLVLLCLGFAGYQFHALHRIGQEAEARREAFSEEMKYFIEQYSKEQSHFTDSMNYARYFRKRLYPPKRWSQSAPARIADSPAAEE